MDASAGEIVYAGAAGLKRGEAPSETPIPGLPKSLAVSEVNGPWTAKINLRRLTEHTDLWTYLRERAVINGKLERVIPVVLHFGGGAPIGIGAIVDPSRCEQISASNSAPEAAVGPLEAMLLVKTRFASDDRAGSKRPRPKSLQFAVVLPDQPGCNWRP